MPHTKAMFNLVDALTSQFSKDLRPSSLLYVGWRHDCKRWWYDTFCKNLGVTQVGVLEIFRPNATDLENRVWCGEYDLTVHVGDVSKIWKTDIKPGDYDIIFWDHGPEHVSKEIVMELTPVLQVFAKKMLLYCCPMGDWPQEPSDGNEWERHLWSPMPVDFNSVGMATVDTGSPGAAGGGELVAWRYSDDYQIPTGGS